MYTLDFYADAGHVLHLETTTQDRWTFNLENLLPGDAHTKKVFCDVIADTAEKVEIAKDILSLIPIFKEAEELRKGKSTASWDTLREKLQKLINPVKLPLKERKQRTFAKNWEKNTKDHRPILKKGKTIEIHGKKLQCFTDSYRVLAFPVIVPEAETDNPKGFPSVQKFLEKCSDYYGIDSFVTTKNDAEIRKTLALMKMAENGNYSSFDTEYKTKKGKSIWLNAKFLEEAHKWTAQKELKWYVMDIFGKSITDRDTYCTHCVWCETPDGTEIMLTCLRPAWL